MDSILQKFKGKFIEEANSLLDGLETSLLVLENEPDNQEKIESAFRAMHTIKGVSSMYGFLYISDYTHHMESIYQNIRDKSMVFNQEIFDLSFESIDHIRKLLSDENAEDVELKNNHDRLLQKIQQILLSTPVIENKKDLVVPAETSKEKPNYTYNILIKANEKLIFRGINLTEIFRDLAGIGEFIIDKIPNQHNTDNEVWSIFYKTNATLQDIEEILLFIEDDVIVRRLGLTSMIENLNEVNSNSSLEEASINFVINNINNTPEVVTPKDNSDKTTEEVVKNEPSSESDSNVLKIKQQIKRISVDSGKLDQLMFLVSELITINSGFMSDVANPAYEPLRNSFEKLDNLSKLFRNNAIEIRLVPLNDTILRFQRLTRDLSRHLNKKVELKTQGTDVELDKNTVDQLAEPLMHMIRNCIDHGIETHEIRKQKGKPETGTIKISANQSGNFIYLSIEDDGTGIDSEKIRHKAIEKGLIKSNDTLTKEDIYNLIFLPGFSTAQSLTDISGRGVGMDVVRKKIADLRGEIIVESELGKGTTFTLKIQQSLSILDTLLFQIEKTYFSIPVSEVEICDDTELVEINNNNHTSTIKYNNELIPFIDLRKVLKLNGAFNGGTKKIIVKNNNKTFSILADKIIGEHQAVLKPLGKAFSDQLFISAASTLGDGKMAFMIDTVAVSKNLNRIL